jgi:hypothetical protein
VKLAAEHLELGELAEDGVVLVVGARCALAPLVVEELLEPLRADRRLEVDEIKVGKEPSDLVEARFIVAL